LKPLRDTLLLSAVCAALPLCVGCGTGRATAESGPAVDPPPAGAVAKAVDPPAAVGPARPADRIVDTTFDTIKFDIQPDQPFRREMIGPAIERLAGLRIRIRGYILPTAQKRGIKQFVLVRDNQECCFGPGAALYDCVLVYMQPGRTAEFSIRPVTVEGTFAIETYYDLDNNPRAVYRLDGGAVR
jgi:hypothetical protein